MSTYPLIDVFKLIASFLVLIIHFRPFAQVNEMLDFASAQIISRVAVPFFLISAGYFIAQKGLSDQNLKKNVYKYLKLYVVWSLVYLPFILFWTSFSPDPFTSDLLIILRDIFFQGTALHLWYLPAVAFALFLIRLLLKRYPLKKIVMIAFFLYVLGLFADGYYGLVPTGLIKDGIDFYLRVFASSRNGLFFAFFFVSFGMFVQTQHYEEKLSEDHIGFGIIGSALFMGAEIVVLQVYKTPFDYNMFLSLIPMSFYLLMLGLTVELNDSTRYTQYRTLSSLIYFSHMWVFYMVMVLANVLSLWGMIENDILRYIVIALLTVGLSFILMKRKAKGGKWVKHLF